MASSSVAIIDYGMGNLHSVASALTHVAPDSEVLVTADAAAIRQADRVVFPGVGAIRDCMAEIRRLGFDQLVPEVVASGKPVLGICVGMQALLQSSEENGGVECIGLLPGEVKFFGDDLSEDGQKLKVPHMGWNQVKQNHHPLWQGIEDNSRFYFVHSYFVPTPEIKDSEPGLVAGHCHYGLPFSAALAKENLFATQFHPEKSHTAGLQLLANFMQWQP